MDQERGDKILNAFVGLYGPCDDFPEGEKKWHELLGAYKSGYVDACVDVVMEKCEQRKRGER